MKKIIFLLTTILSFFLVGCNIGNTPTSKVEDMLSKYQSKDKSINVSYYDLVQDENMSEESKEKYKEIIYKQYENMVYEVKNEEIDGDKATVKVEIEVMDYKSVLDKYNINDYEINDYNKLVLDDLEKLEKKVTYTIEFGLTKNNKGKWELNDLTTEENDKLLGIY